MAIDVKYPDITVTLSWEDGNAFFVMGKVVKAMRMAGVPDEEVRAFQEEAMSGDYDNLLRACMRWVNVE